MEKMPKIILDEAESQGLDRMAAYLCDIDGFEIYSLGVDDKKHWFPGPPDAPVFVPLKDGKVSEYEDFRRLYEVMDRDGYGGFISFGTEEKMSD